MHKIRNELANHECNTLFRTAKVLSKRIREADKTIDAKIEKEEGKETITTKEKE